MRGREAAFVHVASITPSPQLKQSSLQAGVKSPRECLQGTGQPCSMPLLTPLLLDPFEFRIWWLLPGNQLLGWEWGRKGKRSPGPPRGGV